MQLQLLLASWSICAIFVGVMATYLSDFVTLRRQSNWSSEEIAPDRNSSKVLSDDRRQWHSDIADHYQLRFKPLRQMPRLYWPKLTQEEVSTELITTDVVATVSNTELPAEDYKEIAPVTTTAAQPILNTTTTTTAVLSLPTVSTALASNVMNSIMRPPQISDAMQNLLFHGSPFSFKLLQQQKQDGNKSKSKGFLSLFEVIKFKNTKCSVAMEEIDIRVRALEGVCYHEFECKSLGGIPTEPCADGVGVCCVFLTGCGATTKQSVVYFESPNYPNPVHDMLICVLIINLRDNVQQLRLDFIMFEINRPTDGDCVDDQFVVSGQNINFVVPILCGINTGQHSKYALWTKNTYYKLESDLAPEGCLQFYTEIEGVVKSFNYDTDGAFVNNAGATYFNNLNYAICLQRSKDMCAVTYTAVQNGGEQLDFQIVNKDEDEVDLVPDGQAGAGIFNCPDDYIAINQVRLCGERFNDGTDTDDFTQNAAIRDVAAGPIILPVRSNEEYVGRGFLLTYKQELCT
ncbi:unnamed protein product [Ceratitis capitata]|uniref:(Mediterranean fruit fly) hypothetical protein n=1 Tax=Ceratitis capitata TaxID=7213 RepID=A0A811U970_CERCA|nr:unnamed protein product [Ceratitis capitata]